MHQAPVFLGVPAITAGGSPGVGQRRLGPLQLGLETDHVGVGPVLGEGQIEQVAGVIGPVAAHQVDGHVVGGPERRGQGVGPVGRQAGHLLEGHEGGPQDDGVAQVVDPPSAGPPGELGVLARGQELVALPRELRQLFDHHRPGRHVDPQGEGLGGEDQLHQSRGEAHFHRFLERRDHPGVVGRHPRLQAGQPGAVVQDPQVVVSQRVDLGLSYGPDLAALLRSGEAHPVVETLADGVVARRPAEDEVDGGQDVGVGQRLDHLGAPRGVQPAPPAPDRQAPLARTVQGAGLGVGAPVDEGGQEMQDLRSPVPHQIEVAQLDGPALLDHRGGRPPDRLDPRGELLGVGHRGRQAHQPHRPVEMDDDLLPHRPAIGVLEVVDLVEDDVAQVLERRGAGVDHVAEDLGGHDDHGGVTVDRVVPREQSDLPGAVAPAQVPVLLIGQSLQGAGVEGLAPLAEGPSHGVLGHHRFARPGGGGHQDGAVGVEGVHGLHLEQIGFEAQLGQEPGPDPTVPRCLVAHRFRILPARMEPS